MGRRALESLNELFETHPMFTKPYVPEILSLMNEIIAASQLSNEVRCAALSTLQTICVTQKVLIRKSDIFANATIPLLVQCLSMVNKTPLKDWQEDLDENVLSQTDMSHLAQETLSKICPALTVKFLLPKFIPYIIQCLQSQNWFEQYAGLMALSNLTEEASTHFKKELDQLMLLISPLASQVSFESNQDPRLTYAILTCMALLCAEFHPDI